MASEKTGWEDCTVLVVTVGMSLAVGLYHAYQGRRRSDTVEEVLLASRSLGVLPLAMSVLASVVSAIGLVALPAHMYVFGFHSLYYAGAQLLVLPTALYVIMPVFYNLRLTSVFQYIKLRFYDRLSLFVCFLYVFLSVSTASVTLYSSSVALAKFTGWNLLLTNLVLGSVATTYTALGGLRGVVWTDCIQAVILLTTPVAIISRVMYNASVTSRPLRNLFDVDFKKYLFNTSLDPTVDETVFSVLLGCTGSLLYRLGLDQMVVQRYMASRNMQQAKRTVLFGILGVSLSFVLGCLVGYFLYFWYRDCDPKMKGEISSHDQIVPFFVIENLRLVPGLVGLFLAGILSASLSTLSSIMNSQATVTYIHFVKPYFKSASSNEKGTHITVYLAMIFGLAITLLSNLIPYFGNAMQVLFTLTPSISGPLTGLFLLGIFFPGGNSFGATAGLLLTLPITVWIGMGRTIYQPFRQKMPLTLESCEGNITSVTNFTSSIAPPKTREDVLVLYRISSFWYSLIGVGLMLFVSVSVSLLTGGLKSWNHNLKYSSDVVKVVYRKFGFLSVCPENDDFSECEEIDESINRKRSETGKKSQNGRSNKEEVETFI